MRRLVNRDSIPSSLGTVPVRRELDTSRVLNEVILDNWEGKVPATLQLVMKRAIRSRLRITGIVPVKPGLCDTSSTCN